MADSGRHDPLSLPAGAKPPLPDFLSGYLRLLGWTEEHGLDDAVLSLLKRLLESDRSTVREIALRCLGIMLTHYPAQSSCQPAACRILIDALEDGTAAVRACAATEICEIVFRNRAVGEVLLKELGITDPLVLADKLLTAYASDKAKAPGNMRPGPS